MFFFYKYNYSLKSSGLSLVLLFAVFCKVSLRIPGFSAGDFNVAHVREGDKQRGEKKFFRLLARGNALCFNYIAATVPDQRVFKHEMALLKLENTAGSLLNRTKWIKDAQQMAGMVAVVLIG